MRVIIIDPKARTVLERDMTPGDYRAFYPLLDCDTFDIARSQGFEWMTPLLLSVAPMANQDAAIDIYCDDEGLFKERPLYATRLPTGQTLAGKLVLCSSNDDGETIAAPDWLTVDIVREAVQFGTMG
jgi:hypothetical protein